MDAPAGTASKSDRLLAAARGGESAALGQLAQRYRPYLRSVAARLLEARLPSNCSSVVQEALLTAVRGFAQFRGQTGAEFLAWLAQIVRNEALTRLRRRLPFHYFQNCHHARGVRGGESGAGSSRATGAGVYSGWRGSVRGIVTVAMCWGPNSTIAPGARTSEVAGMFSSCPA